MACRSVASVHPFANGQIGTSTQRDCVPVDGCKVTLSDLANCIGLNDPVEEIASFMCRSRREIREKIAELERSGELPGLIEKAAVEAVDEPDDDYDTQGEKAT